MEEIFGIIFRPLAWTMGVPWNEAQLVGMLMGKKIVLTELVAYGDLQNLIRVWNDFREKCNYFDICSLWFF